MINKMTELVCLECGNVTTIIRQSCHLKSVGHIKDLWCYKCMDTTKHFELKDKARFYFEVAHDDLSLHVKSLLWPDEYHQVLNKEEVKQLVLKKRK